MKRMLILLLALWLFPAFLGCSRPNPGIDGAVSFYYQRETTVYWQDDGVLRAEDRDVSALNGDIKLILSEYLKGPVSGGNIQVFPAGTALLSIEILDETASLLLSDAFLSLSGLPLTIACACLTLTTIELTGVETVEIRTSGEFPDGSASIVMDLNCLHFVDTSALLMDESDGGDEE